MEGRTYRPIADYAILGDGNTAALVASDGSIDWLCLPHFDSAAVFCRLLDAERGGWFRVGASGDVEILRKYVDETNVLETVFRAGSAAFRTTQFMPIEERAERRQGKELEPSRRVLTLIEGMHWHASVDVEFRPTFDFARARTRIQAHHTGAVAEGSDGQSVSLACPARFEIDDQGCARGTLRVREGERVWVALTFGADSHAAPAAAAHGDRDLDRTLEYWRRWMGRCKYDGPYADLVRRSALALKLLIFSPTGALVAAPTTSLPEWIGGVRNWDYRYTWLRDSSLILHSLETIGYYDEAVDFFEWLERLDLQNRGEFQIMYTVEGKAELPEFELPHLAGYRGSRPVRLGNAASEHIQADIYGEVLEAAYLCFLKLKKQVRGEAWQMLTHLADRAARHWREPDRGIWEVRGEPRDFLYSRLLCWVALDRALRLADKLKLRANTEVWTAARQEIRDTILERGYDCEVGAFTQSFGSKDLDASALAIQRLGFLPPDDPRVVSTTDRILAGLTESGLLLRHRNSDSLPGGEGTFTLCTLWMVDNLAGQGRIEEARRLFETVVSYASPLGLMSEEIDPSSRELLGNYPQGFTHLGLIRAAK